MYGRNDQTSLLRKKEQQQQQQQQSSAEAAPPWGHKESARMGLDSQAAAPSCRSVWALLPQWARQCHAHRNVLLPS